jgi:hypothetical protein
MALKSTLLLCGAIVAGGAVAGMSMQPHSYFSRFYDRSSGFYGSDANNGVSSDPQANASYGNSYGDAHSRDPSSPNGPPQQYDQRQDYGSSSSYGQSQQQYGPPQDNYGRQDDGPPQQPYGQDQQQGYGQQQQGYGSQQQPYGDARQQSYGAPGSYGPPTSRGEPQMVSLTQIEQADRILPRMPVETANGQRIGEVAQVMMDHGRAREVLLDQGTRIPASDLMYSPARSVLVAQASPEGPSSGYGGNGYGTPDRQRRPSN